MLAVINNAVCDACSRSKWRRKERDDALRWFRNAGQDFQVVCLSAGLDPAAVREAALDYIELRSRQAGRKRLIPRGPSQ